MSLESTHRNLLLRAGVYERKYARLFRAILIDQYNKASQAYPNAYIVDPNDYRDVLFKLYTEVLPREAQHAWDDYVKPLTNDQKDIIDDIVSFLGLSTPEGELIRIWREASRSWLNINILSKIRGIAETTQKAIAKVIENALNNEDGTSIDYIRRTIEKEAKGEVNKSRAMLIARTETMTAMSKGRRLSMLSSNIEWEKKWIDTPDNRTRVSHRYIALEDYRPLLDPYTLNIPRTGGTEECQHPSDPILSAGNCVNCRCSESYRPMRDSSGRPIKRTQSYDDLVNII